MEPRKLPDYNPAIVSLYKGVIYEEDKYWRLLIKHQIEVRRHFEQAGLGVLINESEGFAYLTDLELIEDQDDFPKLIEKRQLSYSQSILCIILRKKIAEHIQLSSETQVRITKQEIKDLMLSFIQVKQNDESKGIKKIEESINKLIGYGFLRELQTDEEEYEIRRILISFIDIDFIKEVEQKLKDFIQNPNKEDHELD